MNRLGKILLFVVLIYVSGNAFGERINVNSERISLQHGLSQSTVYCALQDSRGFMWFGTLDGLNKYNGIDFKVYRNIPNDSLSLPNNTISALLEFNQRYIWVGTENGLALFDSKFETFKTYKRDPFKKNSLTGNTIRYIFEDWDGNIWIATSNGLNRYVEESDVFQRYTKNPESGNLPHGNIWSISQNTAGQLWLGTSKGFCLFDVTKGTVVEVFDIDKLDGEAIVDEMRVAKKQSIRSIFADEGNDVWLGTNGAGLYKYNVEERKLRMFFSDSRGKVSIQNDRIRTIFKDKDNKIWFGSYSGLNLFDERREQFYNYQYIPEDFNSISNNKVIAITQDNLGQLWVGTYGAGVNKINLRGEKFKLIKQKPYVTQTLSSSIVLSICESQDSLVWIGTDNGINCFNRKTEEFIHYEAINKRGSLSDKVVYALYEDKNKDIWAGTAEGYLNKLNRANGGFTKYNLKIKDHKKHVHFGIRVIYEDTFGKFWVGTHNGLFDFNRADGTFKHYHFDPKDTSSLGGNIVWAIYEDSDSNLWIGTDGGGLNKFAREKDNFERFWYNPGDTSSISSDIVRCIVETEDKYIWVGTSSGLNKLNKLNRRIEKYTTKDGLSNDLIYAIVHDGEYLWLSTNKGINRVNPYSMDIKTYDISDGLQSNEFNQGAFFKSNFDGRIYFGGIGGLNYFLPEEVHSDTAAPIVYINNIILLNEEDNGIEEALIFKDEVILPYKKNSFVVEYIGLHFYRPKSNLYKYKMEGLDDDWVFAGKNRSITYSNLPAGDYELKVKAANADGIWSEEVSLKIIILPPFWQTTWFYVIIITLSIIALYLFIRFRMRRINWEKDVLARKVVERTMEVEQQNEEISSQRDSMQVLVEKLKQRNEEIEAQRDQIEVKNNKLMDSIIYAQRIQKAILPSIEYVKKLMPDSFTLFLPKDIVSGDFYWVEQKSDVLMFAAVDCTGHGVPGALMSVIAYEIMNQAINEHKFTAPNDILNYIHASLNLTLLTDEDSWVKEGMDIAFCSLDRKTNILEYAGAFNPLYIIRNGELLEFKADNMPIVVSSRYEQQLTRFTINEIKVEKEDSIYIFTDGYVDQFGGAKRKKFLRKRFKELLLRIHSLPMNEQKAELKRVFAEWKGDVEQIDDVLVMGVKI